MRTAIAPPGRRVPPYGRGLIDLRRRGMRPKHGVLVALGYWPEQPSTTYYTVVMPPADRPEDFDWSMLQGLDIVIQHYDATLAQAGALVAEILRFGPRRLRLIERRGNVCRVVWIKSVSRGIERTQLHADEPAWEHA